jgi:hypothetical protein
MRALASGCLRVEHREAHQSAAWWNQPDLLVPEANWSRLGRCSAAAALCRVKRGQYVCSAYSAGTGLLCVSCMCDGVRGSVCVRRGWSVKQLG